MAEPAAPASLKSPPTSGLRPFPNSRRAMFSPCAYSPEQASLSAGVAQSLSHIRLRSTESKMKIHSETSVQSQNLPARLRRKLTQTESAVGFERKFHPEGCSGAHRALDRHSSAERGADGFYNGQSKARAAELAGSGPIHSVKSLEDVRDSFGGDANARVRDFENCRGVAADT